MKKNTIILFILFICGVAKANNIDSLKHLLNISKTEDKPRALLGISNYYQNYHLDSALLFAEMAIYLADSLNQIADKGNAFIIIADVKFEQGEFSTALEYYNKALHIYTELNQKQNTGLLYSKMGKIYATKIVNRAKAEDYFTKAQSILQDINYKRGLAELYFNQGEFMLSINKKSEAIKYLELYTNTNAGTVQNLFICYSYLADIYISKSNFKAATKNLSLAIIYKDSVQIYQNKKQLSNYKNSLLIQKREEQIKQLKHSNIVHQEELKKRYKLNVIISVLAIAFLISLILVLILYKNILKKNNKLNRQKKEIVSQKEDLETANATLLQAKILAEKHSEFKSDFLANVGHELRTPLNAIIGYAKLMYNSITKKSNIKYLDNISQASDNLLIIIDDLLDFSMIESGKMIIDKTPFNPVNIVTKTISTLRIHAEEKSNALEIHIDPNIPDYVYGDQNHLSQILTHIIRNAIKFSPLNKPISIEVHCSQEGTNCIMTFIVTDHGIGIEESKQEAIFESFNQIRNNDKKKYSGTGLGLSIVKRLVNLQEGSISLNSKPNEGTTFTINIPYSITNKPINLMVPENKENSIQEKVKILLVEDNEINQELAKDTILSWGNIFQIDIAENGKEAIIALENSNYNLILMDIQMPEMDGHEATLYIRNNMDEEKNKTPIIGMTAHALQSEKDLALKNGMDEYITKPFNPIKLKQIISSYVFR